MRLLGLADACRAAGLTVVESAGWQYRGYAFPARPKIVIAHHTGTPASAPGDMPTLGLLIRGRSDLPGPLCQVALSRSGVVHIVAGGKANHAGKGAWQGITSSSSTVGIEAEHPGGSAPWPAVQLAAYDRLCAALLRHLGQRAPMLCGHKEWALPAGRKPDPNYDMAAQRHRVDRLLAGTHPVPQEDVMNAAQEQLLREVHHELRTRHRSRFVGPDGKPSDFHDTVAGYVLNIDNHAFRLHSQQVPRLQAEVVALTAAVKALADNHQGMSGEAIQQTVKEAVDAALADVSITLTARAEQ